MKTVWIVVLLFVGFLIGVTMQPTPNVHECLSICMDHIPELNEDTPCK